MLHKPKPEKTALPFHKKDSPGKRFLMADSDVFPGSNAFITLRKINDLELKQAKDFVIQHKHNVDSYLMIIGDSEELTGLEVEVFDGDKKSIVKSPASIFIPAGTEHYDKALSGSGCIITIVLNGNYIKSLE
jgi:2-isopropylmalate synthase